MTNPHDPTGKRSTDLFDVLEALEAAIATDDFTRRQVLAETIDSYARDHAEEFAWAMGPQAPSMLFNLLLSIDCACRSDYRSGNKLRPIRPASRKPEGGT